MRIVLRVFAAFLATMLFSVSAVAANRTSRILGGTEANFWRILLATLFLAILANVSGHGLQGPALGIFFISGLVGFGIGDLALYQAFPRLGARLPIMLVHCLAAPMAAVIERLWLHTRISGVEAAFGAIILCGVCLALAPSEHLHLPRRTLTIGVAMGIIAAIGQAVGAVLSRKGYDFSRSSGFQMDGITAAYQRIWGGLLVASLSMLWVKIRHAEAAAARKKNWKEILPFLLVNVTAGPSIGVACFQWALGSAPTAIVLPIVALTPLAVIPVARVVENERPSRRSIIGGVIAVAGVIGLTWARLK